MVDQQQRLQERLQERLQRHAIERLELSVRQAEDWVAFYTEYGPSTSRTQWENTLLYRISLLRAAIENASDNSTTA